MTVLMEPRQAEVALTPFWSEMFSNLSRQRPFCKLLAYLRMGVRSKKVKGIVQLSPFLIKQVRHSSLKMFKKKRKNRSAPMANRKREALHSHLQLVCSRLVLLPQLQIATTSPLS